MLAAAALLCGGTVHAHKASDAYLQLNAGASGTTLRVDVALRDLDVALDLDADGDGRLTWAEVRAAQPAMQRYVLGHVRVAGCALEPASQSLERRSDGVYAALVFRSDCTPAAAPTIRYTLLADIDPTHRGIASTVMAGRSTLVSVLDPQRPAIATASAEAGTSASAAAEWNPGEFVREGIHHIVTGYDHVLFLLCLLLPAVMTRTPQGWRPVARLSQALWPVVGIVTAFTLAHSMTLGLAAMKWVSLPSWFIEPAIAVTIVLAALDNLRPIFRGRRAGVTFLFGLIHGFGFAGVLGELSLPPGEFVLSLLLFNLGLELGQLMIVVLVVGGLYLMRGHRRYPAWAIGGGSMAAIAMGVLWFVERTADLSLLPL
jgi:hypothetical protein